MFRAQATFAFILSALARWSQAVDIYVSPNGSDQGDGTVESPLASIQDAVDAATAGTTIYLRAGTFSPDTNIQITATSGTSDNPITITAYNDEKVIIDGEALTGYVVRSRRMPIGQADKDVAHQPTMGLVWITKIEASFTSKMSATGDSSI
jgi:hypothetical protein